MTFETAAFLFCLAITAHNLEEAVWLPAWSRKATSCASLARWRRPVDGFRFRFAVVVLTALAWGLAYAASNAPRSPAAYALCGYAVAMAVNVVVPHLAATVALRGYAPGLATALALNLPAAALLLSAAVRDRYAEWRTLLWSAPLVALALAAAIPVLFRIGWVLAPARPLP